MISSDTYETMLAVLHAKIRTGAKLTPNDAIDIDVNNDAMISLHNQLIVRRTKTGDSPCKCGGVLVLITDNLSRIW